jgi:hypothetical protein
LIVAEMERAQRKGKVFVDWSQNTDYKSTIAAYSLRAKRHREFVSMPVQWEELDAALAANNSSLLYFLAPRALERLEKIGDLFAPVLTLKQKLPEAFAQKPSAAVVAAPQPHAKHAAPRASVQGGRRRFIIVNGRNRAELRMEMEEVIKVWQTDKPLGKSLPQRISLTRLPDREAAFPRTIGRTPGMWDFGTVELISGSERSGRMELYFAGEKLKGEYTLARGAEDAASWTLSTSRAPAW